MEQTVWMGRRWSAANAYLRPARKTGNVRLLRAHAQRVVIEDGRAVGVEVRHSGRTEVIRASGEVIVAASSINSPKLLMLSGIGPAAHLAEHGIEVVADRPGVGQNLQDHLELYIQMASSQPITLYKHWNVFSKAVIGAQWLFTKTGMGASNQFESAAFIRSKAGIRYPDIQYHFLPIAVRYDGKAAAEQDWEEFRNCIRLTREIFAQDVFKPYVKSEIQPGAALQTDDQLDAFIRDHAESAYHPCGTCRMGRADDPDAVVDPQGRVIGVAGLRVADSSIFPRITNGNLNAPSMMVGEKISDHILGLDPLPASNGEPWINPAWETSQR